MTRKPRTYTYRIPLDDRSAMIRLRRFQRSHDEYMIHKLNDRDVPNAHAKKNWGCVFYQSKETRGDYMDEFEGGAIPGLEQHRYSLDWEPTPETELLEYKRGSGGGTQIRGEQFLGTHDPRISDYMHIELTVPWTKAEFESIFDGEPVPDRKNYTHDPPMIDANEARKQYQQMIQWAMDDAFKDAQQALIEAENECDHDHAIETSRGGFCEDCGREWHHEDEMMADEVNIVGTA